MTSKYQYNMLYSLYHNGAIKIYNITNINIST